MSEAKSGNSSTSHFADMRGYKPCALTRPQYAPRMKTKMLESALKRVEQWRPELQDQLAQIALEIDGEILDGVYHATAEELAAIDEGLRAAAEWRFATDEEVEATFAKFRGR